MDTSPVSNLLNRPETPPSPSPSKIYNSQKNTISLTLNDDLNLVQQLQEPINNKNSNTSENNKINMETNVDLTCNDVINDVTMQDQVDNQDNQLSSEIKTYNEDNNQNKKSYAAALNLSMHDTNLKFDLTQDDQAKLGNFLESFSSIDAMANLVEEGRKNKRKNYDIPSAIETKYIYNNRKFFTIFTRYKRDQPKHQKEYNEILKKTLNKYLNNYNIIINFLL